MFSDEKHLSLPLQTPGFRCVWFSPFPVSVKRSRLLLLSRRRTSGGDTHFRGPAVSSKHPPPSSSNFLLSRLPSPTLKSKAHFSLPQASQISFLPTSVKSRRGNLPPCSNSLASLHPSTPSFSSQASPQLLQRTKQKPQH